MTNRSMLPTLSPGDHVFVAPGASFGPGDLVVATHPARPGLTLVKRVGAVTDDGAVELRSDNPTEGTDSRQLGPTPRTAVVGPVVARL